MLPNGYLLAIFELGHCTLLESDVSHLREEGWVGAHVREGGWVGAHVREGWVGVNVREGWV